MKTRLTILYSICCISMFQGTTFSQTSTFTHRNDSSNLAPLSTWGRIQRQTDKIITSNVFQMTYIGVPLIVSGLIIKNEDDHFQSLRNTYIPNFRYHYDDYLQYLPAVAMLGLKIGGVQGRSHHRQYHGSDHQYGETYGKCHPSGWFEQSFFPFRAHGHGIYGRHHVA